MAKINEFTAGSPAGSDLLLFDKAGVGYSASIDDIVDASSLKGDLFNQEYYKKSKFIGNGYLPNSIKSKIKSFLFNGNYPVNVSVYANLYGGNMNTIYDIPPQKSGTFFTIFTENGDDFPQSTIRFLDVNHNLLDYFTLSGTNKKTVKPTTSSDIYAIVIQANNPTNQNIMVVIGEQEYVYKEYEPIQTVTLNSPNDISSLSTINNGTYICLSENITCEIEYVADIKSEIDFIEDNIFDVVSTNSIVENSIKDTFKNIQISNTDKSTVKLLLYTNLFIFGEGQTIIPLGIIKNGDKISVSTEDCSPFLYEKISFLNTQGVEMDYYTLKGYGYKREGLTLNLSSDVWAIKIQGDSTSQNQKLQVSLGEKALEYSDYVRPQICTFDVNDSTGWESFRITSDKMYIYSPDECTISADYYIDKNANNMKHNVVKYVSCGDSFTAGDFEGATDTRNIYDYESGYYKTYPWWIARRNNMNLLNMAHCGDTMRDFMAIYKNIPLDADYVTIAYGLNDYSNNIPIGTLSDTQADNTFLGCWNTALSWILENLPFAHVGVIIMPAYMGNDYRIAMENVCKKYGIPCLNLYSDNRVPMFMNKDGADETVASSRYNKMVVSSSNGHPNVKAHKFISTSIEGWLKSI